MNKLPHTSISSLKPLAYTLNKTRFPKIICGASSSCHLTGPKVATPWHLTLGHLSIAESSPFQVTALGESTSALIQPNLLIVTNRHLKIPYFLFPFILLLLPNTFSYTISVSSQNGFSNTPHCPPGSFWSPFYLCYAPQPFFAQSTFCPTMSRKFEKIPADDREEVRCSATGKCEGEEGCEGF